MVRKHGGEHIPCKMVFLSACDTEGGSVQLVSSNVGEQWGLDEQLEQVAFLVALQPNCNGFVVCARIVLLERSRWTSALQGELLRSRVDNSVSRYLWLYRHPLWGLP